VAQRLLRSWRIVEVHDAWDLELDVEEPARLVLDDDGRGELVFFLLQASVDARVDGGRLDFTWAGMCELEELSGRGIATPSADGHLDIHLWIHLAEEMDLRATPG
jgi:hypothetical protein